MKSCNKSHKNLRGVIEKGSLGGFDFSSIHDDTSILKSHFQNELLTAAVSYSIYGKNIRFKNYLISRNSNYNTA